MGNDTGARLWRWLSRAAVAALTMVAAAIYACGSCSMYIEPRGPYIVPADFAVLRDVHAESLRVVFLCNNFGRSPAHNVRARLRGAIDGIEIPSVLEYEREILPPRTDPSIEMTLIVESPDYRRLRDGATLRFGVEVLYQDASGDSHSYCGVGTYIWDENRIELQDAFASPCPAKLPTEVPRPIEDGSVDNP